LDRGRGRKRNAEEEEPIEIEFVRILIKQVGKHFRDMVEKSKPLADIWTLMANREQRKVQFSFRD
jgi:hypothetical protein